LHTVSESDLQKEASFYLVRLSCSRRDKIEQVVRNENVNTGVDRYTKYEVSESSLSGNDKAKEDKQKASVHQFERMIEGYANRPCLQQNAYDAVVVSQTFQEIS
jgi:hypothetical protein